jgi:site-specific DNA recombinase
VLNVMASVSQWERKAIGDRTRDAMAHKKAQGQRVGGVPFGSRLSPDGVSRIANLDEQRALRILGELRQAGYTLNQLADELNRQGFRTCRGSAWQIRTAHHLLNAA